MAAAAPAALRARALALYRAMLRAARRWEGDAAEADYIRTEARAAFLQRRAAAGAADIEAALKEGEDRLALALHYKIAYPRLPHAPQHRRREYQDVPVVPSRGSGGGGGGDGGSSGGGGR